MSWALTLADAGLHQIFTPSMIFYEMVVLFLPELTPHAGARRLAEGIYLVLGTSVIKPGEKVGECFVLGSRYKIKVTPAILNFPIVFRCYQ